MADAPVERPFSLGRLGQKLVGRAVVYALFPVLLSQAFALRRHALTLVPGADGWAEFEIPVEEPLWASHELTKVGDDVEVLEPPELRALIVAHVTRMARRYGLVDK